MPPYSGQIRRQNSLAQSKVNSTRLRWVLSQIIRSLNFQQLIAQVPASYHQIFIYSCLPRSPDLLSVRCLKMNIIIISTKYSLRPSWFLIIFRLSNLKRHFRADFSASRWKILLPLSIQARTTSPSLFTSTYVVTTSSIPSLYAVEGYLAVTRRNTADFW